MSDKRIDEYCKDWMRWCETATPKFVPQKELGIYDIATFQRQCEAARNPDKGMV